MNTHNHSSSVVGFGRERAALYDTQAVVACAGYHEMHELIAASVAAALPDREAASLLFVGIGTGQDVMPFARYGKPGWRFTGVDPSAEMLAVARQKLAAEGLLERTELHACELRELPRGPLFDGGEMIGVLHHVTGEEARLSLLREVTSRLTPGAPFVLGCRVGMDPVLVAVEEQRFVLSGGTPEQVEQRRAAMASMKPPASDAALFELLSRAGLVAPRLVFASLHFKVFLTRFDPAAAG